MRGTGDVWEELERAVQRYYDAVSASVIIWVPKLGESKSGQMVSEKSEMIIIWSISITNNVKSYKKINERAQTANFSVLSRLRQEPCAENPKNKGNKRK